MISPKIEEYNFKKALFRSFKGVAEAAPSLYTLICSLIVVPNILPS